MNTLIAAAIRCSLMFTAIAAVSLVQPAQAYTVTLEQVGSDVVANGSGAIDLTGLTFKGQVFVSPGVVPKFGDITTGASAIGDLYTGLITGPSFGSGYLTFANSGTGDLVSIFGLASQLQVPASYVSGAALSDSATYNNATFSSLGVTPGTYVWRWGAGANQNFTLIIGVAGVPDGGSTFLLLTLGFLALVAYRKTRSMKPLIRPKRATPLFVIALIYFGLSPAITAVVPPPDGGYPGQNTAEGDNALFHLTIGTDNTALGFQALFSNTIGNFNTATGSQALLSNTTGEGNTATGSQALSDNTTGFLNTAIGFDALSSNINSSSNTAVGAAAMFFNLNGSFNTAVGTQALINNTRGGRNTAIGVNALFSNTDGRNNTATGFEALANVSGSNNTANGYQAMVNNGGSNNTATGFKSMGAAFGGFHNTANGAEALFMNTEGSHNTADGAFALRNNTAGSNNIALGFGAGRGLTTGDSNIDIGNPGVADESGQIRIGTVGTHTDTFIAGIRQATVENGLPVVVGGQGKLGTLPSSVRFKQAIKPMDKTSEAILALKPVIFRYKNQKNSTPQFGLLAEDVAGVNPDLVVRDENGDIYTVRYDAVNAMLLNEFLKEHWHGQEQDATIARLQKQIEALTADLQKVSAQLEASKPAPRVVNNP